MRFWIALDVKNRYQLFDEKPVAIGLNHYLIRNSTISYFNK